MPAGYSLGVKARIGRVRLLMFGAASAAFQTLLTREMLTSFGGNEAVIAAVFAPWLFLGAAGAALGRRGHTNGATWALAAWGPASMAALIVARVVPRWFPVGSAPGPMAALGYASLLLAAPCVLSGVAFTRLATERIGGAAHAYLAESVGAAISGASLSLLLLGRVSPFAMAAFAVAMASMAAWLGSTSKARWAAVPGMAVAVTVLSLPVGSWALGAQARHLAGAIEHDSARSSIVVSHASGEVNVFVDRVTVASSRDAEGAEEAADLVVAMHAAPRRVAFVGVPPVGAAREVLRHGVDHLSVLIDDPALLDVLRAEFPGDYVDRRISLASGDTRRAIEASGATYDVVLIFSAEPSSAARNRMLTLETLLVARASLRAGGLLALALPGHAEYANTESRRLHSSVRRTLEAASGSAVYALPATQNWYLSWRGGGSHALGADLPRTLGASLAARGIAPRYLTMAVLEDFLSQRRLAEADRWSSLHEAVNRDLRPTTYRLAMDRLVAELGGVGAEGLIALAAILCVAALAVLGPRTRPIETAVLGSGATALSCELLAMFAYQAATGVLFRELGLLLAAFMLGAALGAWGASRWLAAGSSLRRARRVVLGTDVAQAALALVFAIAIPVAFGHTSLARPLAFVALVLAGALPGAQFAAAARALPGRAESVAGALMSADLFGAALAALVTFTFLLPAAGLAGSFVILAGAKFATSALLALPDARAFAHRPSARWSALLPVALGASVLLVADERTFPTLYGLTFVRAYRLAVLAALLVVLALAFEPATVREKRLALARRLRPLRAYTHASIARLAWFALLLPIAVFPLGRCYFRVPFVLCHVCPRPCVFGAMRGWVVPVALAANVGDHAFCEGVCPLGTAQSACDGLRGARARPARALRWVRLATLLLVALGYFVASDDRGVGVEGRGLYAALYTNAYAPGVVVILLVALALLAALFVRRPFCEALCPVGAVADITDRLVRIRRRTQPLAEDQP